MVGFSINKQGRSYIRGKHSNLFLTIRMRSSKVDTSFSSAVISSDQFSGKEILI